MSSKKKTETTQTQDNSIDPFSRNLINTGVNNTRSLMADNPFQAYEGERVAGLTDAQNAAQSGFKDNMGVGQGYIKSAADAAQAAGGYSPERVGLMEFNGENLAKYQNPYQQSVIDASMAQIGRQEQGALKDTRDRATSSGAYGGSRHGVAEAETKRAYGDIAAQTIAGLNSEGFNTAAGLYNQDANRQLSADTFNSNMGMQNQQLGLQSASLMGQLGESANSMNAQNAGLLNMFGAQEQNTNQAGLDAQYQEEMRAQEDVWRRIQTEMGLTGLTPVIQDSSGSGTSVTRESNPMGWAGLGLQGASMLAMSDRRLKRDIKPMGKRNGHKWYSFKYLWSDEPQEGVMAQEIVKTVPDAVQWIKGFMVVDYAKLGVA